MKKIILEKKSISDDVVSVSNEVGQEILRHTLTQKQKISKDHMTKFVEGGFNMRIDGFLKGGNILTVEYIMYFVESKELYNALNSMLRQNANSEADEETNTVKIVSGFINGEPSSDFWETIHHEVEHLYQYGMGMKKRKGLYCRMRELIDRGENDINGYYAGLCCYYTFKHEQDAFVHQFYSFLNQKGDNNSFEMSINNFTPYQVFATAYDVLIDNQDKPQMMDAINYLGYTRKKFIDLVYYRFKRFENKLLNAYRRYKCDKVEKDGIGVDRQIRRMNEWINESKKCGYEIEWVYESIYKF